MWWCGLHRQRMTQDDVKSPRLKAEGEQMLLNRRRCVCLEASSSWSIFCNLLSDPIRSDRSQKGEHVLLEWIQQHSGCRLRGFTATNSVPKYFLFVFYSWIRLYLTPRWGDFLWNWITALWLKKYNYGATWPRKESDDDIFNRLDTIHVCDGRRDRQTPADS